MYPAERVEKILEERWGELSYTGQIYKLLHFEYMIHNGKMVMQTECADVHRLIHGAAHRWARAYQHKRFPFEDFLSAFYETVWLVIKGYTWATDFYLYETMSQAIKKRGFSILRAAGRDKRRAFHEALPLADEI